MTQKLNIKLLLLAGFLSVVFGGFLLHLRIHPPAEEAHHVIPFIAGLLSLCVIPVAFYFRKTNPYAYVLNGMLVIIGLITMANVSLVNLQGPLTLTTLFFGTLFGSGITLLTNFFIGKGLFELEMFNAIDAPIRRGRFWRYPNMGWWMVHVITLSTVYILGQNLWK